MLSVKKKLQGHSYMIFLITILVVLIMVLSIASPFFPFLEELQEYSESVSYLSGAVCGNDIRDLYGRD